jgi:FkbM family methyltransferase
MPVVARAGNVCRSRHSKAILEQEGLADWVTTDPEAYERLAISWGGDREKLQAERQRLARVREAGFRLSDTVAYAAKLMPTLDAVLTDWNRRTEALQNEGSDRLNQRIAELSREAGSRQRSFTDQNLIESLVLPYLRKGSGGRMIAVGACFGAMTRPFLNEGWQAILFEPDTRCHQQLTALVDMHPGRARLEKAAATADHDGTISFHVPGPSGLSISPLAADVATIEVKSIALAAYIADKKMGDVDFIKIDAEGHDFDILRGLDFNNIAPRLVMVEFGDQFADQDGNDITALLHDMRGRGYRACIVGLHALGNFERHGLETRLLAIGVDAVPSLSVDERFFGNILFFRNDDHDFLPSVCDWLEHVRKW